MSFENGKMRRERGFTLIEVMIVVAIIAILATIAYPSYRDSVVRGNRGSAQAVLMDIAQREQQYLLDRRAYTSNLSDLGVVPPSSLSGKYSFSVTVGSGAVPTFTATATPVAGGPQASDGTLSINQAGNKLPAEKW